MLANPIKYRTCDLTWRNQRTRLRSYRKDHITKALKRGNFYEDDFLTFIADHYSAAGLFVDVGAFVGNHAVFFAKHCGAQHVLAFEPFPETFALLDYNIRLNQLGNNIQCVNKAISDQPGSLNMRVVNRKNRGMNRIDVEGDTPVRVTTLDDELASNELPVSFLKIDAEGHGAQVIEGARSIINEHKPTIAIELEPPTEESTAVAVDEDPVSLVLDQLGYVARSQHNATPTLIFEHRDKLAA